MIEKPAGRAAALDLGRFIAALAVYGYHMLYLDVQVGRIPWASALGPIMSYGYLGVNFFFMLSGYVICRSAEGATRFEFARNRATRLYPAFVICGVLTSLMLIVAGHGVSPLRFVANMTFQAKALGFSFLDPVYWSLAAETLFYAAVFLIVIGPALRSRLRMVLVVWAVLAVLPIGGPAAILLNLKWAPYFGVGIALHLIQADRRGFDKGLFALYALLALYGAWSEAGTVGKQFDLRPAPLVAAVLVFAMAAILPWLSRVELSKRGYTVAFVLGGMSYPLYLLHNQFNRPLLIARWEHGLLAVLVENAGLMLLCYLVFKFEEKIRRSLRALDFARYRPGRRVETGA
ncbi:acyltransferase [Tsuneonella deserti]|uniref:Acyltransferase n=1 Tax=Tsuneonella deserti TaxID=2035528 RepID=A0ABQ1SCV2_9SPHN|nr:acyltransferase [Tsuneonella deserti]GGE03159.1 acyltransferase [Tsuneonella deserti]